MLQVAYMGFVLQAQATGKVCPVEGAVPIFTSFLEAWTVTCYRCILQGPLAALSSHLSNPFGNNILKVR